MRLPLAQARLRDRGVLPTSYTVAATAAGGVACGGRVHALLELSIQQHTHSLQGSHHLAGECVCKCNLGTHPHWDEGLRCEHGLVLAEVVQSGGTVGAVVRLAPYGSHNYNSISSRLRNAL